MSDPQISPIHILLVDDDEGDIMLTTKALKRGKVFLSLSVARDGVEAMQFLRREGDFHDAPTADLVLLDLNMPRKDGRQTLTEIKSDANLRHIPVVVLTTSDADKDVAASYDLAASCYVTKPVDYVQFNKVVRSIEDFWLCVVKYPQVRIHAAE